jgi:hypothetical protein
VQHTISHSGCTPALGRSTQNETADARPLKFVRCRNRSGSASPFYQSSIELQQSKRTPLTAAKFGPHETGDFVSDKDPFTPLAAILRRKCRFLPDSMAIERRLCPDTGSRQPGQLKKNNSPEFGDIHRVRFLEQFPTTRYISTGRKYFDTQISASLSNGRLTSSGSLMPRIDD